MVDKDVCIGCGACASACPVEAISLDKGYAEVDKDKCIKCGTCEGICPVGAIKLD